MLRCVIIKNEVLLTPVELLFVITRNFEEPDVKKTQFSRRRGSNYQSCVVHYITLWNNNNHLRPSKRKKNSIIVLSALILIKLWNV